MTILRFFIQMVNYAAPLATGKARSLQRSTKRARHSDLRGADAYRGAWYDWLTPGERLDLSSWTKIAR